MEILIAIDKILQLAPVRWGLLVMATAATVYALWCRGELGVVRLQRDAANGQAATYRAHLETQNAAVIKAGAEAEAHQKRLAATAATAKQMKQEADKWRKKALETPLTGTCDEMVDQVIQTIKQ